MLAIPESQFEEKFVQQISPSFATLLSSNYSIPPWTDRCFWNNVRSPYFSLYYFINILDFLGKKNIPVKKNKSSSEDNSSNVNLSSLLLSILHLSLSYSNFKPGEGWESKFDQLTRSTSFDPLFFSTATQVFAFLKNIFKLEEGNLKFLIVQLLENHTCELMSKSVPLFLFHNLYRQIRYHKTDPTAFFTIIIEKLKASNTLQQTLTLFYFLRFLITIYPDLSPEILKDVTETLKFYLSFPFPISAVASELGQKILNSIKYPGMLFYKTMKKQIRGNSIYKSVPFYYEQSNISLPHYIYSPFESQFAEERSLAEFTQFYLKSYFKTSRKFTFEELLKISTTIKFRTSFKKSIAEQYQIKEETPNVTSENVLLPQMSYLTVRYPPVANYNSSQTVDTPYGFKVFNSIYSNLVSQNIYKPLETLVNSFENPHLIPPIIQKHVVVGNDQFLSIFLQALYVEMSVHFFQHSLITHSIVFIPTTETTLMGRYLASICPIYSLLISSVYSVCSTIAPTHDENSSTSFIPIEIENSDFENNIWFCDPSPSSVFQNSIHQLLYFGDSQVEIALWNCRFQYDDGKYVDIPWITSIQIGKLFDPTLQAESVKLKATIVTDTFEGEKAITFHALAVWNVNTQCNLDPTSGKLLFEYSSASTIDADRKDVVSTFVESITVTSATKFTVYIDQYEHQNINSLMIQRITDPRTEQKMGVSFNIFTPFR